MVLVFSLNSWSRSTDFTGSTVANMHELESITKCRNKLMMCESIPFYLTWHKNFLRVIA